MKTSARRKLRITRDRIMKRVQEILSQTAHKISKIKELRDHIKSLARRVADLLVGWGPRGEGVPRELTPGRSPRSLAQLVEMVLSTIESPFRAIHLGNCIGTRSHRAVGVSSVGELPNGIRDVIESNVARLCTEA